MPQGKSDNTGLLVLGGLALLFILRQRGLFAGGAGAAEGLDLSATGPGPEPGITSQPFQPSFRPGGGVVQQQPQPLLGTQLVEGALTAFTTPGTGFGTQLVRPQQPKPQFIPVAEFERRFPRGIVVQKTGAEQAAEALGTFGGQVQQFFGGLFR